jgi:DNA-binding transcriptional MerR regulator
VSAGEASGPLFRPIGAVAAELGVAPHVLRFWQERFPEVAPVAQAGGRRYYRQSDIALLRALKQLLHVERMTLAGVRRLIDQEGAQAVARRWRDAAAEPVASALPDDWRDAVVAIRARLASALAAARSA